MEELLLALAYVEAKQPDEAARWHKEAAAWLDRPRLAIRTSNMIITQAINPWNALGEMFKPIDDPRYNPFDWETWYECEVFRAEVERRLAKR